MVNILFIVEGAVTEEKILNAIYNTYYEEAPNSNRLHQLKDGKQLNIECIENANISKFLSEIEEDEYGEAIGLDARFGKPNVKYSYVFVIIDADLEDKSKKHLDDASEKIRIINDIANCIWKLDNSFLIINSPQVECLIDDADTYTYGEGEKYKKIISRKHPNGFIQEFSSNVSKYLVNQIDRYQSEQVKIDCQALHAINSYSYQNNEIKVRSNIHHILLELEMINETDLLEFIQETDNKNKLI